MMRCEFLCHVLIALFFIKIALKLSCFSKKMQTFRALGAPPPNPRATGSWGFRPQIPIGLRRLGAPPLDPQDSPPHCEFLATRLGVHLSAGLH